MDLSTSAAFLIYVCAEISTHLEVKNCPAVDKEKGIEKKPLCV